MQAFAPQPVITQDNVTIGIDTVVYYQVTDAVKATYEVANVLQAMEQQGKITPSEYADATGQDLGLHRGAQRHDFVRVDADMRLLAEELFHHFADARHARHAADQHDFVDVLDVQPGVLDRLLARLERALDELGDEALGGVRFAEAGHVLNAQDVRAHLFELLREIEAGDADLLRGRSVFDEDDLGAQVPDEEVSPAPRSQIRSSPSSRVRSSSPSASVSTAGLPEAMAFTSA